MRRERLPRLRSEVSWAASLRGCCGEAAQAELDKLEGDTAALVAEERARALQQEARALEEARAAAAAAARRAAPQRFGLQQSQSLTDLRPKAGVGDATLPRPDSAAVQRRIVREAMTMLRKWQSHSEVAYALCDCLLRMGVFEAAAAASAACLTRGGPWASLSPEGAPGGWGGGVGLARSCLSVASGSSASVLGGLPLLAGVAVGLDRGWEVVLTQGSHVAVVHRGVVVVRRQGACRLSETISVAELAQSVQNQRLWRPSHRRGCDGWEVWPLYSMHLPAAGGGPPHFCSNHSLMLVRAVADVTDWLQHLHLHPRPRLSFTRSQLAAPSGRSSRRACQPARVISLSVQNVRQLMNDQSSALLFDWRAPGRGPNFAALVGKPLERPLVPSSTQLHPHRLYLTSLLYSPPEPHCPSGVSCCSVQHGVAPSMPWA
ncbi:unnamed protein product [Prorocentrum cordatum]|uniref:Uncharacterized protein n=1 Tax=Prorocentrum cordatum TaxID=2364126 RepID=A0ABN9VBI1_9DINO|nr:unnamed protein product [Polarella glacialis]